LYIKKYN